MAMVDPGVSVSVMGFFNCTLDKDTTMDQEIKNRIRRKYLVMTLVRPLYEPLHSPYAFEPANNFDEVIELSAEAINEPYHVVSCILFGKVAHKRGVDNCFYDGVNISVRSDDEKIAASLPSAWLIQNGSSRVSEVVIKVAAMPSLWVFGIPKYTYEEVAKDGQLDRGSVLTAGNGSVPVPFLLVRFPPTVVLRNIFLPHRQGKRKIKGCIELIKNQNANHFAQYLNFYLAVHDDNARAAGTDSAQQGIV
jgi:hypothetical protein